MTAISFQYYLFIASATTAPTAIEFTFVSKSSERDVKITGALVPVKMLPFTTLAL
jgi:hypothetical protein